MYVIIMTWALVKYQPYWLNIFRENAKKCNKNAHVKLDLCHKQHLALLTANHNGKCICKKQADWLDFLMTGERNTKSYHFHISYA